MLNPEQLLEEVSVTDMKRRNPRYKHNGIAIPSVTELLSFIDSESLVYWANRIGRQGIDNRDVLRQAADFGTMVHESIEQYLKGKPVEHPNICLEAFKQWWAGLNSCHVVKILGQEQPMTCEHFGGTYDLLISIDDKPYLVDFKTSNHVGYKYFMQLAAYRYLIWKKKKISLEGCLVLQFNKESPQFKEYSLTFSNPVEYEFIENCFKSFMGLVYTYYNVKLCQRQFGVLF